PQFMGDAKLGFFASALHFHPHARLIPIRELERTGQGFGGPNPVLTTAKESSSPSLRMKIAHPISGSGTTGLFAKPREVSPQSRGQREGCRNLESRPPNCGAPKSRGRLFIEQRFSEASL
ncbi:MAG TPA: hypothetical protein VM715_04535, partial [Candidatus Acidoferrum sp.]|nr:hypothetical protein [Candidatus Acidoferrum sp.]